MPHDLYERDILEWSEHQADLLSHLARHEKYGAIDWMNVIEEIASVGRAQLNDVRGLLRQAMHYIVRIHLDWNDAMRPDWELELGCSLDDAADQITPSMRVRIDLDAMWGRVRSQSCRHHPDDPRCHALPDRCPWTLDALLANDRDKLFATLAGWPLEPL